MGTARSDRTDGETRRCMDAPALRSLVLLAAARKPDAFEELVRRYRPMALGYAWSRLGDWQEAEDAVQNAFIAAWRSLDQIRDPERFPGWLRRVVHSQCERLRRAPQVPTVELDDIAHAPSPDTGPRDRAARLEQAVRSLPDGLRNVVTLFYYGERSMREVGRFLGLRESTVKRRLYEGRQKLRETLAHADDARWRYPESDREEAFVEKVMRLIAPAMTDALWQDNPGAWGCEPADIWAMLCAALMGDAARVRALAKRAPDLVRAEYWYTQPLHFAVREGHVDVVKTLLALGADPTYRRYSHEALATVARDRGHEEVARIVEDARVALGLGAGSHEVHGAASAGDADRLRALVTADRSLLDRGDDEGFTPLHRAVEAGEAECVHLLLEFGAAPDAVQAGGGGNRPDAWYRPAGQRPIDLALRRNDTDMVRVLLASGAALTIDVAAAMGDADEVGQILDSDPDAIGALGDEAGRPMGQAARRGHIDVIRALLKRGVDPNLREGRDAPRGRALWQAAQRGDSEMVRMLLEAGADPNAGIESSGTATWMAKGPKLRRLFEDHGGHVDATGHLLDGDDEAVLAMADADPDAVSMGGCGGIFTMVVMFERRDMLQPLLDRGVRVPDVVTGCRTYLWKTPDMTRVLLEHGMNPNLPNWQRVTPLHDICSRGGRGQPDPIRHELLDLFLEFGAEINALDEEYRSTPLGWAARSGLNDMVELLLERGADPSLAGELWATPMEWARRRGHLEIEAALTSGGAG